MNDLDLFMARTQARLAYILIAALMVLALVVIFTLIWPNVHVNSEIVSLLVQVVTGVLALAGTATAYFFARHRPPTTADGDGGAPLFQQTTSLKVTESPLAQPPATPAQQEKAP